VDLARHGGLAPHTTVFPLADADRAFDEVRGGRLTGRAVLVPD
jgi:propanol-preferring alcohol dehydrogenase